MSTQSPLFLAVIDRVVRADHGVVAVAFNAGQDALAGEGAAREVEHVDDMVSAMPLVRTNKRATRTEYPVKLL